MSLRDEVKAVIREIEREKREARRVPGYALDVEVKARFPGREKEVREALRSLYKEREIEAGRTLNNTWIRTKNERNGV